MTEPCTEKETITILKTHQEDIRTDVKDILKILRGNGEGDLKTQVTVHKTYFKLIAYIGGPVLTFILAREIWSWIQ